MPSKDDLIVTLRGLNDNSQLQVIEESKMVIESVVRCLCEGKWRAASELAQLLGWLNGSDWILPKHAEEDDDRGILGAAIKLLETHEESWAEKLNQPLGVSPEAVARLNGLRFAIKTLREASGLDTPDIHAHEAQRPRRREV